jgi:hemerythrin-like domain-containing protein
MDAIQFLLEEHQKVRTRFQEIEHAGPQQRGQLFQQLLPELKLHEEIEDTYLYGPLSKDPAAQGTKVAGFEEHQDEDVAQLEQKIKELQRHDPASEAWLQALREVRDTLMSHVQEEEQDILPAIQQLWDREKLTFAGEQMARAKQETMQNPHHYATAFSPQATESARRS